MVSPSGCELSRVLGGVRSMQSCEGGIEVRGNGVRGSGVRGEEFGGDHGEGHNAEARRGGGRDRLLCLLPRAAREGLAMAAHRRRLTVWRSCTLRSLALRRLGTVALWASHWHPATITGWSRSCLDSHESACTSRKLLRCRAETVCSGSSRRACLLARLTLP